MRLLVILAAVALLASAAHAADFVPGRVIVKWRSPATARLRTARALVKRSMAPDRALVETTATRAATLALVDELRADPDVEYAEPDYIRTRYGAPMTPNDLLYPKQWALPLIQAPDAWGNGARGLGGGHRRRHRHRLRAASGDRRPPRPRRRLRLHQRRRPTPPTATGAIADPTDTGDSTDVSSALHGTHVAGIIAADANNGIGVAGLDWNCRLLIARALGISHGTGVDSDISDAIRWAAGIHVDGVPDNPTPADVINMSFGGTGFSQTMQDAIHDAVGAGAIVVAAAGNLAVDAKGDSPAGLDGVITVGAVDSSGKIAAYSNYGSVVALMAPGGSPERDPTTGTPMGVLVDDRARRLRLHLHLSMRARRKRRRSSPARWR